MTVLAVIPARYGSSRFPGKPLADIAGRPMIEHVYRSCERSSAVDSIIVATDDERIVEACQRFGGKAEITSPTHVSGTDRAAEVAARYPDYDIVLNVQGDEPGMKPQTIQTVSSLFSSPNVLIATAVTRIDRRSDYESPNCVKVVMDSTGDALYFSRAAIPFYRDSTSSARTYHRHLGIYGFRRATLLELTQLPPSALELAESLEQLRWMEAGYRIRCTTVDSHSLGIDTPEDLSAFLKEIPRQ